MIYDKHNKNNPDCPLNDSETYCSMIGGGLGCTCPELTEDTYQRINRLRAHIAGCEIEIQRLKDTDPQVIAKEIADSTVKILTQPVPDKEPKGVGKKGCKKCGGNGWVWWNELDNNAGHDPTDDTKYPCDVCVSKDQSDE